MHDMEGVLCKSRVGSCGNGNGDTGSKGIEGAASHNLQQFFL